MSVGVFFAMLGLGLHALGERTIAGNAALALLLVSAIQSGIELSLTNVTVLMTLLLLVFGESRFQRLPGLWQRWSEAAFALIRGPLRWNALLRECAHTRLAAASSHHLSGAALARLVLTLIPAAAVTLTFTILLSAGNAVLAKLVSRIATFVEHWLLDISFARTAMWICWLTVGVAFFWPCSSPDSKRWWIRALPLWNRREETLALWQSVILLVAVNGVFFAANTTDAIYLWSHAELPAGVTYSAFVHQGVYSLICAVVLAGGLLAIVFQQQPSISRSLVLRVLALCWVFQNLVLIAGVLRRLQLYVDAYQLSELRVYVGCFLLLVCVGLVLLSSHIHRGMNLARLIGSNAIATLALFFILQFCDVGTWVGRWNVAQWKADPRRTLDMAYLASLGPRGWPALPEEAQDAPSNLYNVEAESRLQDFSRREMIAAAQRGWRSYQHRRDTRAGWLVRMFPPAPQN